ncbi:MAG: response regulator [Myxococcota bacterium]
MDEEILAVFRAEAGERLAELAELVAALPATPLAELAEVLAHARRLAHNVKGGAAVVGHDEIEALAHALEDALEPFHRQPHMPPESLLIVLETTVNVARRALEGDNVGALVDEMMAEIAAQSAGTPPSPQPHIADGDGEGDVSARGDASVTRVASVPAPTSTIRVETERLDRLMAFNGELLVTQSHLATQGTRMDEFQRDFEQALATSAMGRDELWHALVKRLDDIVRLDRRSLLSVVHLSGEMNDAIKRLRMLPLRSLEPVWRRVVSDAATKVDKEVELRFELGDVELDRYLLDKLRDPLMHFLRNAVDHGIEPAAERIAAGKPVRGQVLIRSSMLGTRVRVEISDDGRGFSRAKIVAAARDRDLIGDAEASSLSDSAVLAMLFLPGFSTAERISRLSGRGVGLDVVKRRVEELGGSVEIEAASTLGGATFVLTLPVSLLSTKGLLVRAAASTFALPTDAVSTTLRVRADALEDLGGTVCARPTGAPLRVRWLTDLLGLGVRRRADKVNVVVVRRRDEELGIIVDDVLNEQEFVTHPLPWNLQRVPGVYGVIRLAEGALAIALDVAHLFDASHGRATQHEPSSGASTPRGPLRVLVVDDSATVRATLEKMLARAEYRVSMASDGEEAWSLLQRGEIDVVVSDVQMPRLDGFGLTRRIRASPTLEHLAVILVTNLDSAEDIAQGAAAGADEYLVKGSLSEAALVGAVRRLA